VDRQIVICEYKEIILDDIFSDSLKPFCLMPEAEQFRATNFKIFKLHGGLEVTDNFISSKLFIRTSTWNSNEGYGLWEADPCVQPYLFLRQIYHTKFNIKFELSRITKITNAN
jgi:hypothetical protein